MRRAVSRQVRVLADRERDADLLAAARRDRDRADAAELAEVRRAPDVHAVWAPAGRHYVVSISLHELMRRAATRSALSSRHRAGVHFKLTRAREMF